MAIAPLRMYLQTYFKSAQRQRCKDTDQRSIYNSTSLKTNPIKTAVSNRLYCISKMNTSRLLGKQIYLFALILIIQSNKGGDNLTPLWMTFIF